MYGGGFDDNLIKKLNEYKNKFDDGFPLMCWEGSKEELITLLSKCIKNNEEYVVEYNQDEES